MAHALEGSRRKLRRAEHHIHELNVEVAAWINRPSDQKVVQMGRDGEWHTVLYSPQQLASPEMLPLICGDAVQNMRSALDFAVCDLVRTLGQKVSRNNAWPVCHHLNDFAVRVEHNPKPKRSPLHGIKINGQAWAVVEQAQPYNRPLKDRDGLAVLASLSNRDKHEAIYVQMLFTSIDNIQSIIGWDPGATPEDKVVTHRGPLPVMGQTELMRLRFPSGVNPNVYVKQALGVAPYFSDGPTGQVGAVAVPVPYLTELRLRVEGLLDELAGTTD